MTWSSGHLRWWIIALVCLGTIMNYLARNSLGVLAPVLQHDLGITTQQYSYIVAAFQLAYTVMQPVCGFLLDLFGLRLGFALFAALWSLFNVLHAAATGWLSLAFFRGLLGLSEAAAIPAGIKAVAEWFPARERSVAIGWFNAGTSLGAMLAPPLVTFVVLRSDWRGGFVATGVLGFVWAALWYGFYRSPADHPGLGVAERGYILSGQPKPDPRAAPSVAAIVQTRRFWGIALPRALAEPAWQTFSFWIPLYLATERHMDLKEIALFAWLPFVAADLGGIAGGYLSPFLIRRFGVGLVPSRIAGIVLGAVLMLGMSLIGSVASAYVAIALLSLGGFAHQMISALLNTLSADVFDAHEVATANGLTGTVSWAGGLSFSLVVGALAGSIGYGPLFVCLSLFDILGAAIVIALLRGAGSERLAPGLREARS